MKRLLVAGQVAREYIHPLEDEFEDVLHEHENHRHFFGRYHIDHWYQRVYVEVEVAPNELGDLYRALEVFELLFGRILHLFLHLQR